MDSPYVRSANFLFEIGIHAKTPRSGFWFLGSGQQSLAEHTNRAVHAGMVLAFLDGTADAAKVMQMCLFHDIAEGRTSDLNYVHQIYAAADEKAALNDIVASVPFGEYITNIVEEYKQRTSKEALLAKDADNIEFLLSMKEQHDTGNPRALIFMANTEKRLMTDVAKELAKAIISIDSTDWWYKGKDVQEYWVDRKHHRGHG